MLTVIETECGVGAKQENVDVDKTIILENKEYKWIGIIDLKYGHYTAEFLKPTIAEGTLNCFYMYDGCQSNPNV